MRLIFLLLSSVLIMTACLHANAQVVCDGSLGDAVINQDFGSGPNPGPQLSAGFTNMIYTTYNCPDDGLYTIAHSLTGSDNCHPTTWHNVLSDHTGNPNGYMMIINANNVPSVFFTATAKNLCPNTVYQFKAYIMNLITLATSGVGVNEPDLTFSVEKPDGTEIVPPVHTGTIQPTNDPTWVADSIFFKTPADVSEVVVKLTNNAPGGNGNDLILDDITFRACGPAILAEFNGSNSTPPSLCQGDNATYNFTTEIQQGIYSQPAYQWQQNTNNGTWADIPGETSTTLQKTFTNAAAGNYQYRLGVADGANISSLNCRVYSGPLIVNVYPKPQVLNVDAVQPPVCEGSTLSISAPGGYTYHWVGPGGVTYDENPLVIDNIKLANAGPYTVTASTPYCTSAPFPLKVTVNPKPVAKASGGTTICSADHVQLNSSGGVAYSWSPGKTLSDSTIANPVATPTDNTTYKVTVTSANGCTDTTSVNVNVLRSPVANAGPDKAIFEGQSVKLSATAQYSNKYSWTPTTGLSDPGILNPIASPTDDITYTLTVSSDQDCGTSSDHVFVRVYKKITIPTSFSPNNDGINDLWNIDALITYPQSILIVFNRNGQQVYRTVGYSKPWNGKYNGQPVPSGTYYYVLDLKNNTPKISGWVVVVR